jgi:hypothetical protein
MGKQNATSRCGHYMFALSLELHENVRKNTLHRIFQFNT